MDYTLNSITGEITFTPALGPGDVVNASYDWYVPELIMSALLGHSSIVPSSWVVYRSTGGGPPVPMAAGEYTIDTQSGAVIFSSALDPGDTITADYTYYNHTTTLPVLVNVATNRVKLELGSPNTFDITNELVTDVPTYSITDETVATVLPYQRVNEFVTSVPTSMVTNEPVIGNAPVVVTNEFVLYSLGGDTEAYLDHGSIESGNVDKIIAGTYTLYNNDIPMTETVDYTLSVFTGKITFTPPLPADCIITADYSYCKKAITEAYLDHCSATQERIVSASYTIYDGGIPMTDSVQYTLDLATGEITFKGAYTPLPLGAVITASYSYYLKITTVYLDYPGLMADEIDVVKKSYTIYNNSVKLIENTDYKLYPTTGKIDFLNTYKPLPVSAKITATYSYYYLVNNAPLDHGPSPDEAVVGGSSDLWRFTSFNNKSFVYITTGKEGSVPWGFDLPNGNITNYTHLCIIKKAVFYTLELGINFTVDAITGHVQMISADFANPTSGWSFYAWYRYVEPLSEPYDYTIDSDSGMISFNVLLNANDVVMANYSYYNPGMYHLTYFASTDPSYGFTYAQLKYRNVVSGSYDIGKNGELLTEHTDYEIDMVTGIISFMIPLAPTDAIFANYTYTDASRGLFNNNGMFGGHSTESRSGDWRYYYVNIPDQGLFKNNEKNLYLYLNVSWELDVSDIDIMVYGKTTQTENPITEDSLPAERYGAYTLGSITKSDGSIYTTTGTSQEFLATPLVTGLNLIALRNTIINGTESHEQFGGEIGWLRLSSTSVSVTTNELSGEASVTAISNVNWLGVNASVLGPAVSERYEDQEVWQECPEDMEANNEASWPFDYMATYRLASYQKIISVESAATFEVHIWGDENDDLDLGIFYDHNLNGEIDKEDVIDKSFCEFEAYISWAPTPSWSPVAGCPDSDSDEAVKLIQPPDGQYIIAVYGWGVRSGAVEGAGVPALFDMEISMIVAGVEGFGLSGSHEDELDEASAYQSSVPSRPFEEQTFDISWSFPDSSKDGPYGGVLYLGPKQSPKLLPILINIILDRTEPVIVTTLPSENALISDTKPTLSANLEEANMDKIKLGSLDPNSPRMFLDGVEITSLCAVSVPLIPNNADAPVKGYVTGTITYVPAGHLSEGGHIVEVRSSDIAGNTVIKKWGFTIDSTLPLATLSTESDVTYTNINTATFKGTLEIGASLKVQGGDSVVKTYADGTFSAMVELSDGDNQLTFIATDSAGNNIEIRHMAIVDKVSPIFNRLVALDGSTTNKRMTGIYGEMTETGTMELNGMQLPVNSDGTFRYDAISLIEGENTQALKFTDRAGNVAYNFMNITLDTTAPILDLNAVESVVNEAWLNLTGTTDTDASSLTINGKLVDIDDNGNFQNTLRLSQGLNTIVVESKDRAGNSVQEVLTVNFNADAGWVNYGAIGLIVILFVLGLLIGLFLGGKLLGGPKEETDEVPEPTEESLDETLEGPLMEGEELEAESEISDMETPEDGLEPIPDEEAMSEETVPEDGLEPIPDEEAMSETVPEDGLEPIPAEESIPEEMPSETEAPESEEISPEPVPVDEDPRIAKLTDAYESGKISKELYEKNLARFKGQ
ncbi:MAG: hypothetical protein Q7J68_01655 [Thermoplasmata archaeon]|nr:hypothetical protein [Thermoplasmata archaeon]